MFVQSVAIIHGLVPTRCATRLLLAEERCPRGLKISEEKGENHTSNPTFRSLSEKNSTRSKLKAPHTVKHALVIDAGINGAIARQIQDLVRHLTDKPLRYLVNTTYHGDQGVLADVTIWRQPDVVFEHFCAIDLGHKLVELWHFGPGNAPGDTIVYDPDTNMAWTGNFLMCAGLPPMLLEGGPGPYIRTLQAMQATLSVSTIVPGHGPMGDGKAALEHFLAYRKRAGKLPRFIREMNRRSVV